LNNYSIPDFSQGPEFLSVTAKLDFCFLVTVVLFGGAGGGGKSRATESVTGERIYYRTQTLHNWGKGQSDILKRKPREDCPTPTADKLVSVLDPRESDSTACHF
jgi:hypothetical protein